MNEPREQITEAELSARMGQRCITCRVNRRLVGTEPVTKDYEIQSLECPGCRSVVRLAVPVKSKHRGEAPLAAAGRAARQL